MGPGLTLVVGRNGTGKSSFAEGLELALTGQNSRWQDRSTVWKDGWRNLHHEGPASVTARFSVDGVTDDKSVTLRWPDGDTDCDSRTVEGLDELGWGDALTHHRPLLSHSQLSRRLEGRPTDLFEAMAAGLGLEEIARVHDYLRDRQNADKKASSEARESLDELLTDLESLDDERAAACVEALSAEPWKLDSIAAVLAGTLDDGGEQTLNTLRGLTALEMPSEEAVQEVCGKLGEAHKQLNAIGGTDAARAERLLQVLTEALAVHEHDGEQPCPVCGQGTIDGAWASKTSERMADLRRQANEAQQALKSRTVAIKEARQLCGVPPAVLGRAQEVDVDASSVISAWGDWNATPDGEVDLPELANRLADRAEALRTAVRGLRETARLELEHRHSLWRPLRERLATWLPQGRAAQEAEARRNAVREGQRWVREVREDIRAERFHPVSETAQRYWEMMRQNSRVSLQAVALEGVGNRQRLDLSVSVDGADSAALGVMSQGELNTLSLCLFLSRATLEESPFRFLVIDDPVQAMDPAKVDGLASVLHEVSLTRQVVVFTHDTRLRHAVRQMQVDARVIEVTRDANSHVVCKRSGGPVWQNLDDARAFLNTEGIAQQTKERVVPFFCRQAIEAACLEGVWRRHAAAGIDGTETEEAVRRALTLDGKLAFFLRDDPTLAGEAVDAVVSEFGPNAGEVVRDCNSGAHAGALSMEPRILINRTKSLTDKMKKWDFAG